MVPVEARGLLLRLVVIVDDQVLVRLALASVPLQLLLLLHTTIIQELYLTNKKYFIALKGKGMSHNFSAPLLDNIF